MDLTSIEIKIAANRAAILSLPAKIYLRPSDVF